MIPPTANGPQNGLQTIPIVNRNMIPRGKSDWRGLKLLDHRIKFIITFCFINKCYNCKTTLKTCSISENFRDHLQPEIITIGDHLRYWQKPVGSRYLLHSTVDLLLSIPSNN